MKLFFKKILTILIWIFIGLLSINCNNKSTKPDNSNNDDEFPFKSYLLDNDGQIIHSEMNDSDFQSSEDCVECHSTHYEEWTRSPHANSFSNSFFKKCLDDTKIAHGENSKKFCNQCHNPVSVIANKDIEIEDSNKGVSCDVCHTMTQISSPTIVKPNQFVTSDLFLNPGEGIKYGAMENPEPNNYHDSQFNPIFNQSQACLPCHDLRNGVLETEITFTEWNRIPGMAMSGAFPCQQCHMPEKEDGTHDHHFAGVDLSYTVSPEEDPLFEDVMNLVQTAASITFETISTELQDSILWENEITIPVRIESENGHHLPSGTSFNRECWLAIEIRNENENGELIFQNGILENNTQLLDYTNPDLTFFTSFLITEEGDTTQDILEAFDIINYSLPGMNVKFSEYGFELPQNADSLWIQAKLLFRPIKPFIFDELPELKENIPIYTIDEIEKQINIIH